MALAPAPGRDESGGVIGLNGPLVAVLCAAYFVLFVCALSDADGVRTSARREGETTLGCGHRSPATCGTGSAVQGRRCVRLDNVGSRREIPTDRPDDRRHCANSMLEANGPPRIIKPALRGRGQVGPRSAALRDNRQTLPLTHA
jgi:hypothetical protein